MKNPSKKPNFTAHPRITFIAGFAFASHAGILRTGTRSNSFIASVNSSHGTRQL